jgi:hypothetical protein
MISLGESSLFLVAIFVSCCGMLQKGLFRHEVLFASGATVCIEFGEFAFRRKQAETEKAIEAE